MPVIPEVEALDLVWYAVTAHVMVVTGGLVLIIPPVLDSLPRWRPAIEGWLKRELNTAWSFRTSAVLIGGAIVLAFRVGFLAHAFPELKRGFAESSPATPPPNEQAMIWMVITAAMAVFVVLRVVHDLTGDDAAD